MERLRWKGKIGPNNYYSGRTGTRSPFAQLEKKKKGERRLESAEAATFERELARISRGKKNEKGKAITFSTYFREHKNSRIRT